MTFQILECVQCKAAGCVEILPWRTADGMTALSARCDKCDHMVILDMAKGCEFTVKL